MEQPVPEPPGQPRLGDEAQGQKDRASPLQQEGANQGVTHHPHHPVHIVEVEGGDDNQALGQSDAPPGGQGEEGENGHEAQPAQLNHNQNDHLPKQGPLGPGVRQNQSGDAGGRGSGKQSGEKSGALPAAGGGRESQQQGAGENDDGKGGRHNAGGVETPAADELIPEP